MGREVGRVGTLSRTVLLFLVPHLPYMVLHDWGATTPVGGLPRSGSRVKGPVGPPFGPTGGDQYQHMHDN
jgi:hypothetical protein